MYAVITGASSGIGEQFAKRLAKEGYDLILVARRRERLTALSDKLKATHKELECDIFTADLMQLAAAGGQTLVAVFRDDIVFFDAENAGVDQNAGLEVDDHAGLQNAFVAGRDRGRLRAHEAHAMAHTAVPLCRGRTPVLLPELCQRRTDRAKEFSQRHPEDSAYRTGKLDRAYQAGSARSRAGP